MMLVMILQDKAYEIGVAQDFLKQWAGVVGLVLRLLLQPLLALHFGCVQIDVLLLLVSDTRTKHSCDTPATSITIVARHAVPHRTIPRRTLPCRAMPCNAMPWRAVPLHDSTLRARITCTCI